MDYNELFNNCESDGADNIEKIMRNTLYLVGTPIGNLNDISARVLYILSKVDFIAAEDTRNTVKLLSRFGIKKPLISYFEHNKREKGNIIVDRIMNGESCVLVTDAGMPAISDPGEDIVKLCYERNVNVRVIPGPCALVSALAVSGRETGRFCFEGFLSTSKKSRNEHLESLKNEKRTIIFYEAPHKLVNTLNDLYKTFGDRKISIVREITKIHEQVIETTLSEAVSMYDEKPPKGEFVIVLEGSKQETADNIYSEMSVEEHLKIYLEKGFTKKEAIAAMAKDRSISKNEMYKKVLEIAE